MLHSPCPMVVTIHDLAALKRRSEHLRSGLRLRLRHLAVQRAARVIVPTEAVARDAVAHLRLERERVVVIPEAADAAMYPRSPHEVAAVRARFGLPERYLVWVGGLQHPDPGQAHRQARRRRPRAAAGAGRLDAPVGARAARRDPHRPGLRRAARGDLQRRARAGAALRRTRASACRRSRRWPAARRSSPATPRRCARCWASARRSWRRETWRR